jgi:hypothetical protein
MPAKIIDPTRPASLWREVCKLKGP